MKELMKVVIKASLFLIIYVVNAGVLFGYFPLPSVNPLLLLLLVVLIGAVCFGLLCSLLYDFHTRPPHA